MSGEIGLTLGLTRKVFRDGLFTYTTGTGDVNLVEPGESAW